MKQLAIIFRIAGWVAFIIFLLLYIYDIDRHRKMLMYISVFCIATALLLSLFQRLRNEIQDEPGTDEASENKSV